MSKFGLEQDDSELTPQSDANLAARLAAFPAAAPRHKIDVQAMDAAAAPHGFVSREATTIAYAPPPLGTRRRRLGIPEPTRHLAIRLTMKQYERFVGYADRHQLTYHDALAQLLDESEQ